MRYVSPYKTSAFAPSARARGFTLIELMVAIGIIIVLASMLIVGAKSVLSGGNGHSTRVTLAQLNAMLGELDAKTRLNKPPTSWLWLNDTNLPVFVKRARGIDFWFTPYSPVITVRGTPQPESPTNLPNPDAMDAPASVAVDAGDAARGATRQIINTQLVMNLLFAIPNNRAALDKLSPERYYIPLWQNSSVKIPAPGVDGVAGTTDDSVDDVYYPIGMRLAYNEPVKGLQRFRARTNHKAVTTAPPSDATNWVKDTSPIAPLIKDAWGNPIIFVPGSGLRVRLLNGEKQYSDPKVITAIVVSPEGRVFIDPNGIKAPYTVTPGRPFFASAGPDGNFSFGDDNIYSFEK